MNQYLKLEEMPTGNLLISLTEEGKSELKEIVAEDKKDFTSIWLDLLEYNIVNSETEFVMPEKIGALTDSPIIGLNINWDENGEIEENADTKYFWFPNYMVINEFETLLRDGEIVFTKA